MKNISHIQSELLLGAGHFMRAYESMWRLRLGIPQLSFAENTDAFASTLEDLDATIQSLSSLRQSIAAQAKNHRKSAERTDPVRPYPEVF